jgi:glycerate kinase
MRRVVLAPDKLKGTLTAVDAAAALARGFARADLEVLLRPMADGGEGTLEVLVAAARRRGEPVSIQRARVSGPLGEPVEAEFALVGERAVIESARACGLELVPPGRRDALRASSRGLGELARAAVASGARELWIALGGSATTDGGTGFARALGARFLDESGVPLEEGGGALARLERVEPPTFALPPTVGLVDVRSPLLGARGCARLFAPQKGASAAEVALLERGLARLAYRTEAALAAREGAGAAGGLGFGLLVFANAELVPGAPRIAEAVGLDEALEGASLVVAGEGSLDATTFEGKTARHVLARARALGTPSAFVAGIADPATVLRVRELGVREVVLLEQLAGGDRELARRDAAALCERAASMLRDRLLPTD